LKNDPLKTPDDKETPRAVALVLGRSIETLPDDTRRLFAALAAFATGEFAREAALALGRAIGLDNPEASADLLVRRALLDALLDALLNEDMPAESDRERRRLHPLLRAEAGQRLALWSGEERAAARVAVAVWYTDYANATPDLALAPDEANIIGALEWMHEHAAGDLDADHIIARICNGMRGFWRDTGHTRAGLTYLPWGIEAAERVAAETGNVSDQERAANITFNYGQILASAGRLSEAERVYERDLTLRRQLKDGRSEGGSPRRLGPDCASARSTRGCGALLSPEPPHCPRGSGSAGRRRDPG
jgi:hypothetical protein